MFLGRQGHCLRLWRLLSNGDVARLPLPGSAIWPGPLSVPAVSFQLGTPGACSCFPAPNYRRALIGWPAFNTLSAQSFSAGDSVSRSLASWFLCIASFQCSCPYPVFLSVYSVPVRILWCSCPYPVFLSVSCGVPVRIQHSCPYPAFMSVRVMLSP